MRSIQDPYSVAGNLTNCTFVFPATPKHIANLGIAVIVPGMIITVLVRCPRSGPSSAAAVRGSGLRGLE